MWELDREESWVPKNWCFLRVVLEKILKSPLNCQEIQPVHSKGDHSWVFFGRTDVEAETPVLWPPHAKSWLIGKDPDAGREAGRKGDDRGWDGWMASLTRWTWVWVDCGSWWWTGRPGVLWFMGSQRIRDDWVTELNPEPLIYPSFPVSSLITVSLFSVSASLFLFCKSVHLCHILDSTYKWYHMVLVALFLT